MQVRLALSMVMLAAAWWLLPGFTSDFGQDYAAARGWWEGQDPNGTTVELLATGNPDLAAVYAEKNRNMQTAHPPVATLLALPLGRLQWPVAQCIWLVVSWAAVTAAWEICSMRPVVCLATMPLWILALGLGTHEPLLFVLLAVALTVRERPSRADSSRSGDSATREPSTDGHRPKAAPQRSKDGPGSRRHKQARQAPLLFGTLVGLSAAVKVYPVIFLLGLIVSRQYRAVLAAVTAGALAVLVSEILLGWGVTWDWLGYLGANTLHYVDDERNLSLVRLVRLLIPGAPPMIVGTLLGVALLVPIARGLATSEGIRPLLPVVLLASPLTWRYYLGLLSLTEQPSRHRQSLTEGWSDHPTGSARLKKPRASANSQIHRLRWPELLCLAVPPILLLLGSRGVIPAEELAPLVEGLLVLLIQLPLLLALLWVWYRSASGRFGRHGGLESEPREEL